MEKTDARRLRPETQEQIRRQAIRLKKKGMSFTAVGEIVGVHRHAVSKWLIWSSFSEHENLSFSSIFILQPIGLGC